MRTDKSVVRFRPCSFNLLKTTCFNYTVVLFSLLYFAISSSFAFSIGPTQGTNCFGLTCNIAANYFGLGAYEAVHQHMTWGSLSRVSSNVRTIGSITYLPVKFSDRAIQDIIDGNIDTDKTYPHSSYKHFDHDIGYDTLALGSQRLIDGKNEVMFGRKINVMGGIVTKGGIDNLYYRSITDNLGASLATTERFKFGGYLHTLQDFYAHTNWVDTHLDTDPSPLLGDVVINSEAFISGPCQVNDTGSFTGDGWNKLKITSGDAGDLFGATVPIPGDCAHGLINNGIHKDSSARLLHFKARTRAVDATIKYTLSVINDPSLNPDDVCIFMTDNKCPTATSPLAPSAPITTAQFQQIISFSWQDNASNESGFEVERKFGLNGIYASIAQTSSSAGFGSRVSYQDSALASFIAYIGTMGSLSLPLEVQLQQQLQSILANGKESDCETLSDLRYQYACHSFFGGSIPYCYRVRAFNATGYSSYTAESCVPKQAATLNETVPPSAPTGLTVTSISSRHIELAWTASTDNVGVAGYRIYLNGGFFQMSSGGLSYWYGGFSPSTQYCFTISAFDAANNMSAQSNQLCATTLADSTAPAPPPPPPTNLGVTYVESEPNNSSLTANALPLFQPYTGKISTSTDADWWVVQVNSGQLLTFTLNSPPSANFNLEIYGPTSSNPIVHFICVNNSGNGICDGSRTGAGTMESVSFITSTSGMFFARIVGVGGAFSASESYTLQRTN